MKLQRINTRNLDFFVTNDIQLRRSKDRRIFLKCDFPEQKIFSIEKNHETVILNGLIDSFLPLSKKEFFFLENNGTTLSYWKRDSQKSELIKIKLKKKFDRPLLVFALFLLLSSIILILDLYFMMNYPIISPYREIVTLLAMSASFFSLIKSYRIIDKFIISGDKINDYFCISEYCNVLVLQKGEMFDLKKELDSYVIFLYYFKNASEDMIIARTEKSLYLLSTDLEVIWNYPVKSVTCAPEVRFIKHKNSLDALNLVLIDGKNLLILDLKGTKITEIPIQINPSKEGISFDIGDIDGDGTAEIVISDMSKIRVIKEEEIIASYDLERFFTVQMVVADLDNDNVDEIVIIHGRCIEVIKAV